MQAEYAPLGRKEKPSSYTICSPVREDSTFAQEGLCLLLLLIILLAFLYLHETMVFVCKRDPCLAQEEDFLLTAQKDKTRLAREEDLLRARAADAFTEDSHRGLDVHAGLVGALGLAVFVDAHVSGSDADNAITLEEDLVCGEAGVDLDADLFAFLGEELHDVRKGDDVVALLLEEGRRPPGPCQGHRRSPPRLNTNFIKKINFLYNFYIHLFIFLHQIQFFSSEIQKMIKSVLGFPAMEPYEPEPQPEHQPASDCDMEG